MKFLRLLLLISLVPIAGKLFAQPSPCGQPELMTPNCIQACVVCDINGFNGINNSNVQGSAPPGFCTTVWHNVQWIAFLAGSTNLTLRISVSQCQDGPGLEIGIYKSLDCQNYQLVSNCDTDVPDNSAQLFTNTVPLEIGQYYYLVMDGSNGDICNYLVEVVSGTTFVSDLTLSGPIIGETTACVGSSSQYASPGLDGASRFDWTLDGEDLGSGSVKNIDWDAAGKHLLCMTASNACDVAEPSCQMIEVFDSPLVKREEKVCVGDCYIEGKDTVCEPGNYAFLYQSSHGCDSIVSLTLSNYPPSSLNLDLRICNGDTLQIAGENYTQPGNYEQIVPSDHNCDSTIYLNLQVIECNIQGNIEAQQLQCIDTETGALSFTIDQGTPPFSYQWERIGAQAPSGSGSIAALGELIKVNDLPKGNYIINVSDGFGNVSVLLAEVTEPAPISISIQTADYHDFDIPCYGAQTSISALPEGGTPGYNYNWSNNAQTQAVQGLSAGEYQVTVTDANGCTEVQSVVLEQPPLLETSANFVQPDCSAAASGAIRATDMKGGVPPYSFYLDDQLSKDSAWTGLAGGIYEVKIVDANGCEASISGTLTELDIPLIDIGADLSLELGAELALHLWSSGLLEQISWSPSEGLSCTNCSDPVAMPLSNTTYFVTVTSKDGCSALDSISLRVSKNPRIFVPSGFSPNDDGNNDLLTVFANINVEEVISFQVYSRWGAEVFKAEHFAPNQAGVGWDGIFKGQAMGPGVFSWIAEIALLDGEKITYSGDTTLVR